MAGHLLGILVALVREPAPTGLNAYERRVFDRVAGLAVGGMVPLTRPPGARRPPAGRA